MKSEHRTTNNLKSLTLLLSLAPGANIADLQGRSARVTVPLNNLQYDGQPDLAAWFYSIAEMQLGGGSTPAPVGIALRTTGKHIRTGSDEGDARQSVVSRLVFDLEFAADAASFEDIPLVVKGFHAASNAPASFSFAAFAGDVSPVFAITDEGGGALVNGFAVSVLPGGLTSADISDFAEAVQDNLAAALVAGSGQSIAYDDPSNTITFVNSAPLTIEAVQDIVAAMAAAGTGISVAYDDVTGQLLFTNAAPESGGGLTQENVEDIVAALLVQGTNVTLAYNDATGQLTVSAAGGGSGVFSAIASQVEAEGGTDNAKGMTALRTAQAITAQAPLVPARVISITSASPITPNCDATDLQKVTALAVAATFAAPTGTPYDGQKLMIRIKDNATARALTWNAIYKNYGAALPATTVANKTTTIGLIYDSTATKWGCVAVSTEA